MEGNWVVAHRQCAKAVIARSRLCAKIAVEAQIEGIGRRITEGAICQSIHMGEIAAAWFNERPKKKVAVWRR